MDNKTKLQAKLFLFYLRFKKPLIVLMTIAATIIIVWDNWERYKYQNADRTPWEVVQVESGSSFVVSRHDETQTINLCGVRATGVESKKYLATLLSHRVGEPVFENSGQEYDVWLTIAPGYESELLSSLPYEVETSPELNLHLNSWLIEQGIVYRDRSSQCAYPENLANAEKIAKEEKLGLWQGK